MIKNFIKNAFYFSIQVRKQMKWKINPNGVQIFYKDPRSLQNIVFYATPNIKISQFLLASQINERQVSFPQGVNSQTDIVQYLLQRQNAKAIQIKHRGDILLLRNRACDSSYKQMVQSIRDPKGIYQHLQQFLINNKPKYFVERCDYLTRYYLKLQAESFLRSKKINSSQILSPKIKQDLLNYLNSKNEVNYQQLIQLAIQQEAKLKESIFQTQQKIKQLNDFYEGRQNIYKRLAIIITLAHLVSFGYMIFGVEWLGWDIIQPLTYTVGVIYTMLGIRFYRKYKVNRSSQNIREALFKMIMPPQKRLLLRQNQSRLVIQQKQLKKIKQQQLIISNRLAFKTSLIQNMQNSFGQTSQTSII